MESHSRQNSPFAPIKAAEDSRTPRRWRAVPRASEFRKVLECGCPLPLLSAHPRRVRWLHPAGIYQFLCLFLLAFNLSAAAKKPAKMKPAPKIPPGKPEIFQLEPRGIQRGNPVTIKLV